MTPIISNGYEWLFVPCLNLPKENFSLDISEEDDFYQLEMNYINENVDSGFYGEFTSSSIDIPPGSWTIFSTLSEALANEELARQIVEFSNPIDKLLGILLVNSINPNQPHIILKKEL